MEIRQTIPIIGNLKVRVGSERIFKNLPFLWFKCPSGTVYEMDREAAAKLLQELSSFGDNCSPQCRDFRETIRTALED